MNPWEYPTAVPFHAAVLAADYLALGGMLLAMGLAFTWLVRNPAEPACIAAALFAVLGVFLQRIDVWQHVYSFGRVFTPLLFCLAAIAAQRRNAWLLAPVGMMLPRLAMQLAPQMSGVARWII